MAEPLVVVAATANAHKLDEMRRILEGQVTLLARPAGVADIVEDAETFEGNARLKAAAICEASGLAALADDSGLEVDALDGAPGVHSARFAGADADDAANRDLLRSRLDGVVDRRARFRSVLVLRHPSGSELVAEGTCEGTIGHDERGTEGFGYDRLFIPDEGDGRTFAEHHPDEKNAISHRARACRALMDLLSGTPGATGAR